MNSNTFHRPASRHSGLSSVLAMKVPVTIDPRYHDAVIFDLDGVLTDTACSDAAAFAPLLEPTVALARKLQGVDVATAACSSSSHCRQILKPPGLMTCSMSASTAPSPAGSGLRATA